MSSVCTFAGQLKVGDLVTSLREIAHADSQMAYHLWVLVFPIVWATLAEKKDQQVQLAKPIIQLLSKEYHSKQMHHRPNVVQVDFQQVLHCDRHVHAAESSLFAGCCWLLPSQATWQSIQ